MMNFTFLGQVTAGYDAGDLGASFNVSSTVVAPNVTTASAVTSGGATSYSSHPLSVFLEKYYAVFLLAFGTIGNLLSFAVLSRRTFRKTTISLFLRYLTLADLGALYTGVVYFIGKSLFNYDVRKTSELSCKFHRWLSYVTCDLSSWALVLVSTARLVSIVWPMKRLVTRARVYAAIIITTVVLFLVNLPMFVMYGDVYADPKNPKLCTLTNAAYDDFYDHVWGWLVLIKFTLLPGLILVCLNTALIVTVSRTGKAVNKIDEFGGGGGAQNVSSAASTHAAVARWKEKGAASRENKGYDSDQSEKVEKRHTHGTPHKKKLENCTASIGDLRSSLGHLDSDSVCNADKECLKNKSSGASDEIPLTDLPTLADKNKEALSKDSNGNSSSPFLDFQNNFNTKDTNIKMDHGFPNLTDLCPSGVRQGDESSELCPNLDLLASQQQPDTKVACNKSINSGIESDKLPNSHYSVVTAVHLPNNTPHHHHRHHHHPDHSTAGLDDDLSVSSASSEATDFPNSSTLHSRLNGSAKVDKKHRGDHHKKVSAKSKSRSLTRSLLLINTVFLVCTIPISVYLAAKVFLFTGPGYKPTQQVFTSFANFIMYTNNSINFILYCVSGSRFRQQLQLMMRDLLGTTKRLLLKLVWCRLRNR